MRPIDTVSHDCVTGFSSSPPKTWAELLRRETVFHYKSAVVLLSGGMDSTACLHLAAEIYPKDRLVALLVDYGQPHRDRELTVAGLLAERLDVAHDRIAIADALHAVRPAERLANAPHVASGGQHPATVPLRNMILLAIAGAHARGRWPLSSVDIWIGACLDDAAGFVDCRQDFIAQASIALTYGAGANVRVNAPLLGMSKVDLVGAATSNAVVLESIRRSWSCYRGRMTACGECTPCILRTRAFDAHGIVDAPLALGMTGGDVQREKELGR